MWKNILLPYSIAYILTTGSLVYFFKLPNWVIGEKNSPLIYEYYHKNGITSFIFDYFLIAFYLLIAYLIFSRVFHYKWDDYRTNIQKMLIVGFTTLFISSFFWILFVYGIKKNNTFFSRWFHHVGYKAVIYDYVIVSLTYFMFHIVRDKDFLLSKIIDNIRI